jgi:hypothetical protein
MRQNLRPQWSSGPAVLKTPAILIKLQQRNIKMAGIPSLESTIEQLKKVSNFKPQF